MIIAGVAGRFLFSINVPGDRCVSWKCEHNWWLTLSLSLSVSVSLSLSMNNRLWRRHSDHRDGRRNQQRNESQSNGNLQPTYSSWNTHRYAGTHTYPQIDTRAIASRSNSLVDMSQPIQLDAAWGVTDVMVMMMMMVLVVLMMFRLIYVCCYGWPIAVCVGCSFWRSVVTRWIALILWSTEMHNATISSRRNVLWNPIVFTVTRMLGELKLSVGTVTQLCRAENVHWPFNEIGWLDLGDWGIFLKIK